MSHISIDQFIALTMKPYLYLILITTQVSLAANRVNSWLSTYSQKASNSISGEWAVPSIYDNGLAQVSIIDFFSSAHTKNVFNSNLEKWCVLPSSLLLYLGLFRSPTSRQIFPGFPVSKSISRFLTQRTKPTWLLVLISNIVQLGIHSLSFTLKLFYNFCPNRRQQILKNQLKPSPSARRTTHFASAGFPKRKHRFDALLRRKIFPVFILTSRKSPLLLMNFGNTNPKISSSSFKVV